MDSVEHVVVIVVRLGKVSDVLLGAARPEWRVPAALTTVAVLFVIGRRIGTLLLPIPQKMTHA